MRADGYNRRDGSARSISEGRAVLQHRGCLVNNAGVSVVLTMFDELDITEWWQNFVRPIVAVYVYETANNEI